MHAIEKYIERRERERREREKEKVGFSPIGEREEERVLTYLYYEINFTLIFKKSSI